MDEVRERRRRHKLDGHVRLRLDPEQQSPLENWVEYQNYHLNRLEQNEKKRDKLKKKLDEAYKNATDTFTEDSAPAAFRHLLKATERDLERQKVLLQWIEQERQAMGTEYPTSVKEDNADQAAEPAIQDSDAILRGSIPPAPKRREPKPRRTKETLLGQPRPQRVPKARRFTDARAKSLPGTHRRGAAQTRPPDRARTRLRSAPQRPQPAPKNVTTRSGRISRPPG